LRKRRRNPPAGEAIFLKEGGGKKKKTREKLDETRSGHRGRKRGNPPGEEGPFSRAARIDLKKKKGPLTREKPSPLKKRKERASIKERRPSLEKVPSKLRIPFAGKKRGSSATPQKKESPGARTQPNAGVPSGRGG